MIAETRDCTLGEIRIRFSAADCNDAFCSHRTTCNVVQIAVEGFNPGVLLN